MSQSRTFQIFTLAISCALLLPNLFTHGIFGDGLIYSVISRNLSAGKGDFWTPIYSDTFFNPWAEHPPLMFWLESFFFKVLGDHPYTEKLFSLCLWITMVFSIKHFWSQKDGSWWLPVLLWTIIPTVHWGFSNNILENLLVVFTSWAIWFGLKETTVRNAIIVALLVFLGFLTKGLVAFFPMAVWSVRLVTVGDLKMRNALKSTFVAIITLSSLSALLYFDNDAIRFLSNYFQTQLLASLNGERLVQDKIVDLPRYYLIIRLFTELLNPLVVAIVVLLGSTKQTLLTRLVVNKKKWTLYGIIGLTASLPLLISPKQHSFYLMPGLTWFSLGVAHLLWPIIQQKYSAFNTKKPLFKVFGYFSIGLLIAGLVFSASRYDKISRDSSTILFVREINKVVPENEKIGGSADLLSHHNLHGYLQRYTYRSIYFSEPVYWFITSKDEVVPNNFEAVQLNATSDYKLWHSRLRSQ